MAVLQHSACRNFQKCQFWWTRFACFGLSISAISYTIYTHEVSHWRSRLWQQNVYFRIIQLLDTCTLLVLKTAEELSVPSVGFRYTPNQYTRLTEYTIHISIYSTDLRCIVSLWSMAKCFTWPHMAQDRDLLGLRLLLLSSPQFVDLSFDDLAPLQIKDTKIKSGYEKGLYFANIQSYSLGATSKRIGNALLVFVRDGKVKSAYELWIYWQV